MDSKQEYKGYTIEIEQDQFADDPRNWNNLGKMVCFHKRYDLGDKHSFNEEDYSSWDQVKKAIEDIEPVALILPLYLYDHSGLRIKIGSFQGLLPQGHAEFDSGMIGFIYVTKKALKKEGLTIDQAHEALENEVKTYDQYLSGDVWTSYVYEPKKCASCGNTELEQVDGQGDIYGYDEALQLAKSCIDRIVPDNKNVVA